MLVKRKAMILSLDAIAAIMVFIILAGIGGMAGSQLIAKSKNDRAMSETASIAALISEYRQEIGAYPANLDALTTAHGQYGPWLKTVPADPWSPSSQYRYKHDSEGFAVYSVGVSRADGSSAKSIGNNNIGFTGK